MEAYQEKKMMPESKLTFGASIRTKLCNKGKTHWHVYFEILYVLEGHVDVTIEGSIYHAEPGDLIIINSLQTHTVEVENDRIPSKMIKIQFDPSFITPYLSSDQESKQGVCFLDQEILITPHCKIQKNPEVKNLLLKIVKEISDKKKAYELRAKGGIYYLLAWLIQNNYIRRNDYNTEDIWRLKDAFKYIEGNYGKDISSQTAAQMVSMSHNHFCRLFKKTTKKTFTEYLNNVRIHEAEKLIVTTNDSIYEIAEKCGFSSYNYLTRLFSKMKGMSPQKYRNQKRDEYQHSE